MALKRNTLLTIIFGLFIIICTSCSTKNQPDISATIKDQLAPNTCGFFGELYTTAGQPIPNEVVWLGKVVYDDANSEGYFLIDGGRSPSAISTESGQFEFIGIDPSDYAVIVGNLELNPYVLAQPNNPDKALVFQCVSGEVINVGKITIDPSE